MLNNIKAVWQVIHDIKLPIDKIEELVQKRLKRVLISAYVHVPYYRKLMQNIDYNPAIDYKGPEDLRRFPITTKQDLKANNQMMFLKDGTCTKNLYYSSTSGSAGIPLKIFLSHNELAFRIAKWLRVLFVNKYSIKNKVLALTVPLKINEGKTFLQKFGLLRRLAVNLLIPSDKLAEIFLSYKPHVLYGNSSPINLLALELIKRKTKIEVPKLVLIGGEIIHKHNRNLYKQAFGIYPTEFYGSEEMGVMAFETPARDGLHLCDDLTYFEFLDKNNNPVLPGESGRIVVTDLLGTTMPFIRYDQGDIVTIKVITGSDGKSEKRISKIIGRDDDYIILPDGSINSSYYFSNGIAQQFNKIRQFKVIQKTKIYYQVKIATDQNYFNKIDRQFKYFLNKRFPKNCYFEILRVDFIEPDPSGKLRSFVSEIKDNNF
jgi:phenylacetate-CoA ligase